MIPEIEPDSLTTADLEADRFHIERVVGRPLRLAEQAIDVLGLDEALNAAKDELEAAIKQEQRRAVLRAIGTISMVRMQLTDAMIVPLNRLHRLGIREARAELERLGYPPRRLHVAEPVHPEIEPLLDRIRRHLNGISVRVDSELVEADLSTVSFDAVARALMKVPGARDIASQVISRALTSGLQQTFEQNQDLIAGWEYTAVLDGAECEICAPLDGTTYPSWDAIQEVLPDGGPNPDCLGGGRCRCRPIPLGPNA